MLLFMYKVMYIILLFAYWIEMYKPIARRKAFDLYYEKNIYIDAIADGEVHLLLFVISWVTTTFIFKGMFYF